MALSKEEIVSLKAHARDIRKTIIEMLVHAKSGHTAGPLGMTDVFTALYFNIMKHDPKNSAWDARDRIVLSNGHIAPVQYSTMAHAGYFPVEECNTLRKFGTRIQGHPEREKLPGLETTSGPLGSGLSQASGMAYGLRMDKKDTYVYCLMSDGEQQEGNTWEAVMFAAKYKLKNLICFIDRNYIQIDGKTEDIMPLDPLGDKYKAFNWNVIEVDGHDFKQIVGAVSKAKKEKKRPTLIVANTIPGKGVKEIQGDYRWHGKAPSPEEGKRFIEEIMSAT